MVLLACGIFWSLVTSKLSFYSIFFCLFALMFMSHIPSHPEYSFMLSNIGIFHLYVHMYTCFLVFMNAFVIYLIILFSLLSIMFLKFCLLPCILLWHCFKLLHDTPCWVGMEWFCVLFLAALQGVWNFPKKGWNLCPCCGSTDA